MAMATTAETQFLIVVAIGIAAGFAFRRYGSGRLPRRIIGPVASDVTCALVGIAGSFIGFHLGAILGVSRTPLTLYLAAAIGAAVTLWAWRGR